MKLNKRPEYGSIVSEYTEYKTNTDLAEWRLGYFPILEVLGDLKGQTILDFGCGPANFSRVLSDGGARVIGFDADKEVVRQAKLHDPLGDYRVNRGLLADEVHGIMIDTIIATFSFCVIPDRELRYVLQDMRQILARGGNLMILEPNQQKAHGVQYANLHYHCKENVQTGDYVDVTLGSGDSAVQIPPDIYRTHNDYLTLLKEAGFVVDSLKEPLPDHLWEGDWSLETAFPPFLLITAH